MPQGYLKWCLHVHTLVWIWLYSMHVLVSNYMSFHQTNILISFAAPKCAKHKAESNAAVDWVPQCDENGKYMRKQGNDEVCWCAKPRNGEWLYKSQKVPLGEQYDCTSKSFTCILFVLRLTYLNSVWIWLRME